MILRMAGRSVSVSQCHWFLQQAPSGWGPMAWLSSSSSCQDSDQILMRGMVFHGYHGALPEVCRCGGNTLFSSGDTGRVPSPVQSKGFRRRRYENTLGQKFMVDATLWTDLKRAGRSDRLSDTIDYSQVYKVVRQVVEGPPRQLQESVAEDLCQQLLGLDERIDAVKIYIRKPHVALTGTLESVGVQMLRRRQR